MDILPPIDARVRVTMGNKHTQAQEWIVEAHIGHCARVRCLTSLTTPRRRNGIVSTPHVRKALYAPCWLELI